MIDNKKYRDLISYLKQLNKVVIAFSGGVDSAFLVKAAKEALWDNVIAVTVVLPYIAKWQIEEAKLIMKSIGIRNELLEVPVIIDEIKFNPLDRCYLCKKSVFTKIKELTKKCEFEYVV